MPENAVATLNTPKEIEVMRPELERALRNRIPADYFLRVARTTLQKTPRLMQCEKLSLLGALMEAAQLGLPPDGVSGYGYLVPYWNSQAKAYFAQFQPGYRGFVQLAYRGGSVTKVVGREVCAGDEFSWRYGTDEWIKHEPALSGRGDITHFYAVAWLKAGPPTFVVLPREEVDTIRERAKKKNRGKDSPAWSESFAAMGRKTAVRALFRWLPVEWDAQRAAASDERFDSEEEGAPRETPAEVVETVTQGAMDELLQDEGEDPPAELGFIECPSCGGYGGDEEKGACDVCGGSGEVPAPKGQGGDEPPAVVPTEEELTH